MLAPDSRAILMEQLAPPVGFSLDAAVATTFTLDLTATLLPALAFTGFDVAGGLGDPIATLESLRSTASKIDVFCQAGAISVPDKSPDLLAFLEPIVHPVAAPKGGLFHPKIWFVRYVGEAALPSYRLLVLTRNLTLDNSWDLSVRLDSTGVESRPRPESIALGDLIASLPRRALTGLDPVRQQRVRALAREARRVVWEYPGHVEDIVLHYIDKERPHSFSFKGSKHLIVSPFIDPDGVATIRHSGDIKVLSRAEELDKLDPETLKRLDARVLDNLAVLNQVQGSRLGGQLHAKMYVVEPSNTWSKSHVFIGSANATRAAFHNNTEFLIELRGRRSALGIDQFLGDKGDFVSVTEPYRANDVVEPDPSEDLRRDLDNALRRLATIHHSIDIVNTAPTDGGGSHTAEIRSAAPYSLNTTWRVTVELLTRPDRQVTVATDRPVEIALEPLSTAEITPFLGIRIDTPEHLHASSVVIADLRNAPADRLDVILATQIDTPEKFLRFLFFLLSLGNPAALAALALAKTSEDGPSGPFGPGGSGVLEMVLHALATKPSALADLDGLVTRLDSTPDGQKSLPDGFIGFWSVVRDAMKSSGRIPR